MDPKSIEIKARLIIGQRDIPILARYSSKYSLWVKFKNGEIYDDGTRFSGLIIPIKDKQVDLGPCELIAETNIEGFSGKLIFVSDIYDMEILLVESKVVKLQSAFLDLPLILPYKKKIKQEFKNYCADLTYDLSAYKNIFDSVDKEHENEPEQIRKMVEKAIIYTEGRNLFAYLDEKLSELETLVQDFSSKEHEHHGYFFRKHLFSYIMTSRFMARTNQRPRGYSGDSETINMIYANNYQGRTTFEKLMHKHPLEHPAAEAVRNRKTLIASLIKNYSQGGSAKNEEPIKILSVASGPALEIGELVQKTRDCSKFNFFLLDQDPEALKEAARHIDEREKDLSARIPVTFLNEPVKALTQSPGLKETGEQFDFIYSLGYFNYLTSPAARTALAGLYALLKPGGRMVIGNYHPSNPSRIYMKYWLDWVLYYRTEDEMLSLFEGDFKAEANIFFEDTKSQMFLDIHKGS